MPKCPRCAEEPCRCTAGATRIDDGGPAFPESYVGADRPHEGIGAGMSLRDWFAGQALAGMDCPWVDCDSGPLETYLPTIASAAYRMADAMLAERAKGRA